MAEPDAASPATRDLIVILHAKSQEALRNVTAALRSTALQRAAPDLAAKFDGGALYNQLIPEATGGVCNCPAPSGPGN